MNQTDSDLLVSSERKRHRGIRGNNNNSMVLILLLAWTFLFVKTTFAEPDERLDNRRFASTSCIPQEDSCDFYELCLEEQVTECGDSGYARSYGRLYCERFDRVELSEEGELWSLNTRLCLQEALVPLVDESPTCQFIENFAFDTHPSCYADSGFCSLPFSDWIKISATILPRDLLAVTSITQAIVVVAECSRRLFGGLF